MKENTNLSNNIDTPDIKHIAESCCERCDDPLLFAMRDNCHDFQIGLFTVLECLKLAEVKGHVPKLPDSWWCDLEIRFANNYHLLELEKNGQKA